MKEEEEVAWEGKSCALHGMASSAHIKSYNLWQLKRSVTEKNEHFYETKSFAKNEWERESESV